MSEKQRSPLQRQQPTASGPDADSGPDAALPELRASADRLLGIADKAFEHIRTEDSQAHIHRHRQRGGQ